MTLNSVLIDVDTQKDFLDKRAALPVSNRIEMLSALRRTMAWARASKVPVISSLDSHPENEYFNGTPRHCVEGTSGQQKLGFTLFRKHRRIENDATLSLPHDALTTYDQIILRKRGQDFFSNPKADRLLTNLNARQIIVCGVGLECCVRRLVLGLLARHKTVALILEACGSWNPVDGELAARLMQAKGARVLTLEYLESLTPRPKRVSRAADNGQASRNGKSRHSRPKAEHNDRNPRRGTSTSACRTVRRP